LAPVRMELPPNVHSVCGQRAEVSPLALSGGRIEGVVVFLDSSEKDERLAPRVLPSPIVDQRRCEFTPKVLAAALNSEVTFLNSDPLIHNIRLSDQDSTRFNVAMPLEGMKLVKKLDQEGEMALRCDVHPWMRAGVRVFAHNHFAMTDSKGMAVLEGIPVGPQRISVWHPRLDVQQLNVEVTPGKTSSVEVGWNRVSPPGT
jgi:hypothetical protein